MSLIDDIRAHPWVSALIGIYPIYMVISWTIRMGYMLHSWLLLGMACIVGLLALNGNLENEE